MPQFHLRRYETTHMIKVTTPKLHMSAGGPTTSPFNISGAKKKKKKNKVKCEALMISK